MDSCECEEQKNTEGEKPEDGDPLSYDWNVYKPIWVRCSFQNDIGFNRFILDYNRYFLPCCGIVFWSIFLLL